MPHLSFAIGLENCRLAVNGGDKMEVLQTPIPRELSSLDLEDPPPKAVFIWPDSELMYSLSLGMFAENKQEKLLNIVAVWGSGSQSKQANQKAW